MARIAGVLTVVAAASGCFAPGTPGEDGASAVVTVTVFSAETRGQVVIDGPVLVFDRNGDLVTRSTTDNFGTAQVEVPAGGQVTVIEGTTDLTTFAGVEDGDQLFAGLRMTVVDDRQRIVQVPAGPGGTSQYAVYGRCVGGAASTTTVAVRMDLRCGTGPRDLLGAALNGANHTHFMLAPAVALQEAAPTVLTGAWVPAVPFALSVGGVGASNFSATLGIRASGRLLWTLGAAMSGTGDTRTASVPYPNAGEQTYLAYSQYVPAEGDAQAQRREGEEIKEQRLSTLEIPNLLDANSVDDPTDGQMTAGVASWKLEQRNERPDIIIGNAVALGTDGRRLSGWTLVLPAAATGFRLPVLPADVAAAWNPTGPVRAKVTSMAHSRRSAREVRRDVTGAFAEFQDAEAPAFLRTSTTDLAVGP